jgi:hypothetical protein
MMVPDDSIRYPDGSTVSRTCTGPSAQLFDFQDDSQGSHQGQKVYFLDLNNRLSVANSLLPMWELPEVPPIRKHVHVIVRPLLPGEFK